MRSGITAFGLTDTVTGEINVVRRNWFFASGRVVQEISETGYHFRVDTLHVAATATSTTDSTFLL